MCNSHPKFEGTEWSFGSIDNIWQEVKTIAKKYNWEGYPTVFELVSAEQMINCYVTAGLPLMYDHWSFGKQYLEILDDYKKGRSGLAYELVINSNPSICYLMDTNTQLMQMLTISHAAIGHNHFFKNNYMFKQWTKPHLIMDYLYKSKKYIEQCEIKHEAEEVELLLDLAHGLSHFSVDKYFDVELSKEQKKEQSANRIKYIREDYNPVMHGNFTDRKKRLSDNFEKDQIADANILKLIMKKGNMEPWKKKLFNIILTINQYFYPQYLTKLMNEGFASFVHYTIINDLYDKGIIPESYVLEFIDSHTSVLSQYPFDGKVAAQINPYYLGFNMFMDIKRMCENPTQEDIDFRPEICNTNWIETINNIVANYRDDSFVAQFLSPHLIRKLKLVRLATFKNLDYFEIIDIHDSVGYDNIRYMLSEQYSWLNYFGEGMFFVDRSETKDQDILMIWLASRFYNKFNKDKLKRMLDYLSLIWKDPVLVYEKTSKNIWSHLAEVKA